MKFDFFQIDTAAIAQSEDQTLSDITALGYLQGYTEATEDVSVVLYDDKLSLKGVNVINSGHQGGVCWLIDMQGNVLHEWRLDLQMGFDQSYVYENGDLLAVVMNHGLFKVDKDSNIIWAYTERVHHDLDVHGNGDIYVLTQGVVEWPGEWKTEMAGREINSWTNEPSILNDYITILDSEGSEKKSISILRAFQNSDYQYLLDDLRFMNEKYDLFHTNHVEILDGLVDEKYWMFQKGHVLISIRNMSVIAVIDVETEKVTWAMTGIWKNQHSPTVVNNGHILIFDNAGNRGRSQVFEFDPITQGISWIYKGDTPDDFYSSIGGYNQKLANGNILITDTTNGRAFEVTSENKIVWEYFNTYRAGENDELIAVLHKVIRIDEGKLPFLKSEMIN